MNYRSISFILGWLLIIEGIFLTLPLITALVYRESQVYSFLLSILICLAVGIVLIFLRPKKLVFNVREGFATVALSWIIMSLFGCLPFIFGGDIPNFTDALFETVSGFSTTGASILSDVEAMSYSCIFWRSFTHWIGGMGALVFLLAVIPIVSRGESQGGHMNLMKAESPGPIVSKLVPKVKSTALILYIIYFVLTVIEFVILLICRMPVFDAITITFGTAGTGGFGIKNTSIADYSPAIQWVVTIFMALFGVNFNAFFFLIMRKFKAFFTMAEVKCYFGIIATAIIIIMLNAYNTALTFEENLRHVAFQVSSLITTTGYSTTDFDLWPSASKAVLIMIMFVGACAGSTSGGIKVSRFIILFKSIKNQMLMFLHPGTVRKIKMDGKVVEHSVIRSVNVFFITYIIIFAISVFVVSFDNHSFETNFTAILATLSNVGPGLAEVGPVENFGFFSPLSKYVMIFDMLAGRLELYPIILLFYYRTWKGGTIKKDA
ncbi:MAG: TrkH family potassium uptake protein [Acutalibacteraceae bacterium]|nr:TrkH family potassium uptake protein [Acutalibacteraceae bacterium]